MNQVVFVKQIKIIHTPVSEIQGLIQFFQRLATIGFKIPKGMIEIEKKMLVFHSGLKCKENENLSANSSNLLIKGVFKDEIVNLNHADFNNRRYKGDR